MCGEKLCSFLAKVATYDRCGVAVNGHITTRNEPTIGVWWKYMSTSGQICHIQEVCGGNTCPFLAKLVTHNRYVVAINGLIMRRN